MEKHQLEVYVDGSYRNGVSGYGIVALEKKSKPFFLYGGFRSLDSTWQMSAEFQAVMKAVSYALDRNFSTITIHFDCAGVEYWSHKSAQQLTMDKHPIYYRYNTFMKRAKRKLNIVFIKVAAHSGNYYNEYADRLAKLGLKSVVSDFSIEHTTYNCPVSLRNRSRRNRFLNRQLMHATL